MIQWNTTNKSFLKMHYILKEMGIKNNAFFLQLNDETLLNVDPFDEDNLTQEQMIRIHIEISNNPWYYFREIARIPMTDTKIRFELNRGNLAIIWAFLNDLKAYIVLPRQSYKSYTICFLYQWLIYWGAKDFTATFFAQNDGLVTQNLARIKDIREALPKYLNLKSNADTDNSHTLIFRNGKYKNTIMTRAPGMNEDSANNVGRGQSTMGQWYDEFAFIPYIWIQYDAAIPAYSTVARAAEANGSHHHIMISTTAGNKKTKSGAYAYKFLNECASFTELLYDKVDFDAYGMPCRIRREEILDYIKNNNTGQFFLRIEYMWYDLSKPDSYLQDMLAQMGGATDEFNRGVLNIWTDSNEDHPLGQERVQALISTQIDPVKVVMVDKVYVLKYYRSPELVKTQSHHIVFGMDSSGNTRRDYSTLVGVDVTNSEVVCTMRVNQYAMKRFAEAVAYILLYLFPKGILVGERNYVGGLELEIIASIIGGSRIYKDTDGIYGVKLYKDLRKIMYGDILRVSVVERGPYIHDKTIIDEIAGLQVTRDGRIDHNQKNGHDDTLISYLYCRWFIMMCKSKRNYIDEIYFNSRLDEDNTALEEKLEDSDFVSSEADAYGYLFNLGKAVEKKNKTKNRMFANDRILNEIHGEIDKFDGTYVKENVNTDFLYDYTPDVKLKEDDVAVDVVADGEQYHEYSENLDKDDIDKIAEETEEIRDKSNDPVNMYILPKFDASNLFKHSFR